MPYFGLSMNSVGPSQDRKHVRAARRGPSRRMASVTSFFPLSPPGLPAALVRRKGAGSPLAIKDDSLPAIKASF